MARKLYVMTGSEFSISESFKKFEEMNEAGKELSDVQKTYQKLMFFGLKKWDAESPADLDDEKKKEFFNWIKDNWDKGSGKIKNDDVAKEVEDAVKKGDIPDPAEKAK